MQRIRCFNVIASSSSYSPWVLTFHSLTFSTFAERLTAFLREQQLGFKIATYVSKKDPGTKGPHSP
jgi:hypothetical protein